MIHRLLHRLVTPQVSLSQQDSSPLFIIPVASLISPYGKPLFPQWQTSFPPMANLISPCGKPYLPLWHTLFAPVANLICPCGKPYLPLWQTPFSLLFIGTFQVTQTYRAMFHYWTFSCGRPYLPLWQTPFSFLFIAV